MGSSPGRIQTFDGVLGRPPVEEFLDHLGVDSRGPPPARAQAPPDVLDPGPSYDGADFAFPE